MDRPWATITEVPQSPGVYGIFLKGAARLPHDLPAGEDGLIYVGMSRDLASRDYETHFKSGQTGFSTLRRSLGALLKEELELTAIHRGTECTHRNCVNYRFTKEDEERLTGWMKEHLSVGFIAVDGDPRCCEEALIRDLKPVLCLKGWRNPRGEFIRRLRECCALEAAGGN